MNIYSLTRDFWDFSFDNPEKINPGHSAIFFFAIEHCNRLGWKEKFGFPSQMVMEAVGIKNWKTYSKYLNDLVDWNFIKMIEISKNQYSSNIIAIVKNTKADAKADTKALDKALLKHKAKHSQSTVSIDIQDIQAYNNTNIQCRDIVATEVATLQELIKKEFNEEFITDIYKKYKLSKEEFKEECNLFVDYRNEKSINGKKARWEKQKTFDIKLRFRTWMRNNKKWSERTIVNSDDQDKKEKREEIERKKSLLFNKFKNDK